MAFLLRGIFLFSFIEFIFSFSRDLSCIAKKDILFDEYCVKWRNMVLSTFPGPKIDLPLDYALAEGSINKKDSVKYSCDAFRPSRLSYLRVLRFEGAGFNVFNCIALPKIEYDMPILGIDIVSLPGGNLCSIDYQPSYSESQYFTRPIYSDAKASLSKWSRVFPPGGEFMPSAAKYFSPQAVWTRFPHDEGNSLFFLLTQALDDYLKLYATHIQSSPLCTDSKQMDRRREGIKDYLTFRAINDPAKNILNKAFGESWTQGALTQVVFPLDSVA